MVHRRRIPALLALPFVLAACGGGGGAQPPSAEGGVAERARAAATATATSATDASPVPDAEHVAFAELVDRLSEPDGEFFSENIVSNETSYLQVADALTKAAKPGGAYIGVGPEQNFTYLAETKPKIAFIVDIRRQNMVLHLFYRAAFEEASSRAHFAALVLGRAYRAEGDPGAGGSIDQVLAHATRIAPDETAFAVIHAKLRARAERFAHLDERDLRGFELVHKAFFKGQLDTRFSLKQANGRAYPSIGELFRMKDAAGEPRGFLASEAAFRSVQSLEREGRVVPVVGDFAGDRAMPGIAAYLKEHKINVSTFYVSNVEQYLLEPKIWPKWTRNVAAMPTDDQSVFVRCYLDQGKKHPLEMKGHRTATVLQRIGDFEARDQKKPYASFFTLATEPFDG